MGALEREYAPVGGRSNRVPLNGARLDVDQTTLRRVEIDLTDDRSQILPAISRDVPFADLPTAHEPLVEEIMEAWEDILRRGAFIGGEAVEAFEDEFAHHVGTSHAVGVASGTDALVIALHGLGVGAGDEVITAAHTFSATVQAIIRTGARPVLVDVDPMTATMDPEQVEGLISHRTKALLPVHLYGQTSDFEPLAITAEHHGIAVLEDACQAHGAEYWGQTAGSLGTAAAFSFYPGKNLGACGDAGMITTDDADLAERLRMLRDHGQSSRYQHDIVGFNSRLDALQAAALRIKLRHLDSYSEARRHRAAQYLARLSGLPLELPIEAAGRRHVYHLFVARHPQRDRLRDVLSTVGVATGLHYPVPIHLQPAFSDLGYGPGAFPHAENWASEGFSLPMFPELSETDVDAVCSALAAACDQVDVLA